MTTCGCAAASGSSSSATGSSFRSWPPIWRPPARSTITRELAISWARLPAGAHPRHWAARLAIARGFAAYLQTIDPATEVPPADVFAVRYQRPAPYLWSQQDICRLLEAARTLRPPLKAASYEALFGLLAVTGMRVGEAVALESGDVDLDDGVITIREQTAKLERARLVPLHPTTVDALGRYATQRERLCPKPSSTAFFLSGTGAALDRSAVGKTLRKITTALGLRTATVHPRAHDLRHSFAVRTLIDWQRSGVPIDPHRRAVDLPRARQPSGHLLVPDRDPAADGTRRRPARTPRFGGRS